MYGKTKLRLFRIVNNELKDFKQIVKNEFSYYDSNRKCFEAWYYSLIRAWYVKVEPFPDQKESVDFVSFKELLLFSTRSF